MFRIFLTCRPVLLAVACWMAMGVSYASTVDIGAVASGWVKSNAESNGRIESSTNFLTGVEVGNGQLFSNFFVFDLSGINREIGSATLKLQNPDDGFYSLDNDYFGTSKFYEYSVVSLNNGPIEAPDLLAENWSEPSTGAATLGQINGSNAVNYGSVLMNESSNGTIVEIILNETAVNDINTAINQAPGNNLFAIGGNLELPNRRLTYAFGNTGYNRFSRTLTLTPSPVPVPPAMFLFLSGVAVLWRITRKSEQSATLR